MMRTTLAILTTIIICATMAQAQTTGTATANGSCSIANSGPDVTNISINCGIGQEQGKKIIEILNRVLANKDFATINAKLDELLEVASKPTQVVNCGNAGNCAGTNNGTQTFNQYGAPKLTMTDAQRNSIRDAMKPFGNSDFPVVISCQNTEDVAPYAQQMYTALHDAGMKIVKPQCALMVGEFYPLPSGVSFKAGSNRVSEAAVLSQAMKDTSLISSRVQLHEDADKYEFVIYIMPNR